MEGDAVDQNSTQKFIESIARHSLESQLTIYSSENKKIVCPNV